MIENPTPSSPSAPQTSHRPNGQSFNVWKAVQTIISVSILMATLFTLWTPDNLLSSEFMDKMFQALQPQTITQGTPFPTSTATPKQKIGLVAGHKGNDSGAICDDGLTEVDVNLKIATLARDNLIKEGYDVDILDEFDKRLSQYEATALVSIHNDSCKYVNDQATGYKVAAAISTLHPERAIRLTDCLTYRYREMTGMSFHANSVTTDMTRYHAFDEVNSNTPAAIIETGFLNLDREILTQHTDKVAAGISSGIVCYLRNESIPLTTETP